MEKIEKEKNEEVSTEEKNKEVDNETLGKDSQESSENEKDNENESSQDEEKKELTEEEIEEEKSREESDRYIRLMADFQNFKNRVEKQKSEIYSLANEKVITKLLDVLDNFHRALEGETKDEAFKSGMEMILNQLKSVLEAEGLEEIETEGKEFDPKLHNAVMVEEAEGVEENHIIQIFQKGYTLKGKVIRPSMVKVSK